MSAAAVAIGGQRRIVGLKPGDTSSHTLLTGGSKDLAVIVGIIIANGTGSAADATVQWGDGSTDYDIYGAKSVAAHTTDILDVMIPLRESYTLKVKSGTNDALTFSAVVCYTGSAYGPGAPS